MRDSETPRGSAPGQRGPRGRRPAPAPHPAEPPCDAPATAADRPSDEGANELQRSLRRGLRVLLIEDDPISGKLGELLMRQEGWDVTLVATGAGALEAVGAEEFDVILTDIQMPDLDGLEVTKRLRASEAEKGCRTPIIGLSAYCDPEDRECALRSGMDEYLTKPAAVGAVFAAFERCQRRRSGVETPAERSAPPSPATSAPAMDIPGEVLVEWGRQLEHLRTALAADDSIALAKAAHAMNGGLAIFGARGASDAAHQLEKAAREAAKETLSRLMARLEREVESLRLSHSARP